MIEVEGLTKVYGGSKGAKALDGVSFTVPKGGIFGFLGGGTTLGADVLGAAAVVWLVGLFALALWTFHKKAAE